MQYSECDIESNKKSQKLLLSMITRAEEFHTENIMLQEQNKCLETKINELQDLISHYEKRKPVILKDETLSDTKCTHSKVQNM